MTWRINLFAPPREGSQAGFTLLEMIVVLVVVALIAAIFVGRMPVRSHGLERRALVDAMVEALRGARGRAIGGNRPITIAVNGEHGRFTVEGGPTIQLPDTVAMIAAAGPAGEAGKQLTGIRFAPDGSSSGGRIVLADGKRHTSIGIDWLTGRVSVADAP